MHMCVRLSPFAVQQRLARHCKSTSIKKKKVIFWREWAWGKGSQTTEAVLWAITKVLFMNSSQYFSTPISSLLK